jgi:hypothetical protein
MKYEIVITIKGEIVEMIMKSISAVEIQKTTADALAVDSQSVDVEFHPIMN